MFLTDHPDYVGKAVFVQIAVPTHKEVQEYRNLRRHVNEIVGRMNRKFGTIEYTPIHFMHQSVDFEEILALYAVSDACVVTSTRDGMNFVSFEYIACQPHRHGSMILSEFAGATHSLTGSTIVNPWNTHDMARAMYKAVSMLPEERARRVEQMNAYVQINTSEHWSIALLLELGQAGGEWFR